MSIELDPTKAYLFENHSLPEYVDQMDVCRGELLSAAENFSKTRNGENFEEMGRAAKLLNTELHQAIQLIANDRDMGFFDQIRSVHTLKQHELTEVAMGFNWILEEELLALPEPMDFDKFVDDLIEKGLRGNLDTKALGQEWFETEAATFRRALTASMRQFSKRCINKI